MPTDTKATFALNIKRAGYFVDLHQSVHGGAQGAPRNPVRELPRAAVVFAIGALDAYLSDVSAEVLVIMLRNALLGPEVRDILKRIHSNVPTLSLELVLVPDQAEREARLQEAIADHLHNHVSNHGAKAVSRTMVLLNGSANDMWQDMRDNGFPDVTDELDEWTTGSMSISSSRVRAVDVFLR